MLLTPGTPLGPYEILGAIGAGGMGEVYRARDTRLQRDVAIKILPDTFASDPERRARFEREARLLAALAKTQETDFHEIAELPGERGVIFTVHRLTHGPDTIAVFSGGARHTVLQAPGEMLSSPMYAEPGLLLPTRAPRHLGHPFLPGHAENDRRAIPGGGGSGQPIDRCRRDDRLRPPVGSPAGARLAISRRHRRGDRQPTRSD